MKLVKKGCAAFLLVFSCILPAACAAEAGEDKFRIAIMQTHKGAAQKFRALDSYLQTRGLNIQLIGASSYEAAAALFAEGQVDGMFSGSGVAGSLMLKNLAVPVLRPVDPEGHSTYWAVVIAPQGTPLFTGKADYFDGKRVICCSLASSGEFFFRAIAGEKSTEASLLTAPSHGAALAGLSRGVADVAVVKNRVWDNLKSRYPELQQVGQDEGENPNNTLIVSRSADPGLAERLSAALFALQNDTSPAARDARQAMGVQGYIRTSGADFAHTMNLLAKAGVDEAFTFSFQGH